MNNTEASALAVADGLSQTDSDVLQMVSGWLNKRRPLAAARLILLPDGRYATTEMFGSRALLPPLSPKQALSGAAEMLSFGVCSTVVNLVPNSDALDFATYCSVCFSKDGDSIGLFVEGAVPQSEEEPSPQSPPWSVVSDGVDESSLSDGTLPPQHVALAAAIERDLGDDGALGLISVYRTHTAIECKQLGCTMAALGDPMDPATWDREMPQFVCDIACESGIDTDGIRELWHAISDAALAYVLGVGVEPPYGLTQPEYESLVGVYEHDVIEKARKQAQMEALEKAFDAAQEDEPPAEAVGEVRDSGEPLASSDSPSDSE
ncbi:hypothetical protein QJ043_07010 [Olsenella sp. YH-ols2217]|uniref:Uncharacterized protein n=1 Tax=Kribbibacterium absianum TaxID=3044210 RepID=A0ABT6ZMU2_9ACTN|nr:MULTISPECIES: hypothetical protein [unclassified Olsenella]MDJ1121815.1 hypothetical protein [Olsenella sp. YH-ols2216]MDJ1129823.1 hypothetical protein [Olsenella sp. YH-ols2217]